MLVLANRLSMDRVAQDRPGLVPARSAPAARPSPARRPPDPPAGRQTGPVGETAPSPAAGAPDLLSLRALARPRPLLTTPSASLRELIYRMSQGQEDMAAVVDAETRVPLGLVTLKALLHAIGFEEAGLDDPVAAHMIGAPPTLAADASVHRAKVIMAQRRLGQLLLIEPDGRFAGLVTQADLLGLRSADTEALIAAIAAARDVEAMAQAADRVRRHGAALLRGGMGVQALCQWLSELHDLIGIRIIELIEDEHDLPPVPWCWMSFGSEGRLEQTFASDQDNGLLFVPPDPHSTPAIRAAFLPFAQAVNRALHHCGIEHCRGKIMAGNPDWCLSAEEWQRRFARWLEVPDPQAVLHAAIFFDFRPLYGSSEPVEQLRRWLTAEAPRHPRFFHALAAQALSVVPPLGLTGRIRGERHRGGPRTIDLKLQGARFFMDAARLFALRHGVSATNTAERLRAAGAALGRPSTGTAAEIEAFEVIQRLRLGQQLEARDRDTANRIDPDTLNALHRAMLTEALRQARRLQSRLRRACVL